MTTRGDLLKIATRLRAMELEIEEMAERAYEHNSAESLTTWNEDAENVGNILEDAEVMLRQARELCEGRKK